jgi:AcrR family transcriptional regulator
MNVSMEKTNSTCLYNKDPQSSTLGQNLLKESAKILAEEGFDTFTLKKLAQNLQTTESSVYRYFDNKHRLLVYHVNFYWNWLTEQVDIQCCQRTLHGKDAVCKVFEIMCFPERFAWPSAQIDFECMHKILTHQSVKAYFSQHVDLENREGAHIALKILVSQMGLWLSQDLREFEFPKTLITTLLNAVMMQPFYAEHLPSLTELPSPNPTDTQTAQQTYRYVCQIIERLTTQPRTV